MKGFWSIQRSTYGLGSLFAIASMAIASPALSQDSTGKRVTLNIENADLRYALKLLFSSAGLNYTLDQAVQGTVTVSLTEVPFRTALESVLRSTQSQIPLTYRMEDNIYIISPKAPEIIVGGGEVPTEPAPEPKKRFVKIQLNFADVYDIVNAFGGTVISSRFGNMNSNNSGFGGGMGNSGFGGMGGMGGMGGFGGNRVKPRRWELRPLISQHRRGSPPGQSRRAFYCFE
jgi:hypothetical protein